MPTVCPRHDDNGPARQVEHGSNVSGGKLHTTEWTTTELGVDTCVEMGAWNTLFCHDLDHADWGGVVRLTRREGLGLISGPRSMAGLGIRLRGFKGRWIGCRCLWEKAKDKKRGPAGQRYMREVIP